MDLSFDGHLIVVLVMFGVALTVWYITAKRRRDRLQMHGVRVPGVVVRNELCWGETTVMRPVVRFTTQSGQTIETLDKNGTAFAVPRYAAGATVTIVYNKHNPYEFDILNASRQFI
ncbi:DUF3592 domain-containing protein [Microvirga sp. STR05]|uniref:DUF3592 domain-containing protein n=1 Tax=Hymenobacter duratus TaxID=2771356 RepID=A0ABR8JI18_9BACT|nr:DUF3592 domain-containing protein [Hymenobacter duratus]MBR7950155.1 DUF3592 domain-containing protein [Microvirga sp. STR05]